MTGASGPPEPPTPPPPTSAQEGERRHCDEQPGGEAGGPGLRRGRATSRPGQRPPGNSKLSPIALHVTPLL